MITVILALSLLVLGITTANVLLWPRVRTSPPARSAEVSVLIPARDEEANLPACLDAVIAQGVIVGEILVYDDHSTDRTATLVQAAAARDPRIRLMTARPLEPGWTGKNFACANLARAASFDHLLFLDADARLLPGAVDRLRAEMVRRRLEMLSCWPGLVAISFWERVLMPMLNFVVFTIFPGPLSLIFGFSSLALAHGACLLFDRKAYFTVGGHEAVRDQIFEDTRLAQLWRRRGRRALCLDGGDLVRVRMYGDLTGIWQGFLKNFYPAFQRQLSFWIFIVFHLLVMLLPFVLLWWSDPRLMVAAVAVLVSRVLLVIRFRQSMLTVLLHPLAESMLLLLGITSWWRCRTGRGVSWKGRSYHKSEVTGD